MPRCQDGAASIEAIDPVQLAMPAGQEGAATDFYEGMLATSRVPKPAHLETRGGCWFQNSRLKLHLGVDTDFRPAGRAHPALLVDGLGDLFALLRDRGVTVVEDQPLKGYYRAYADDPFGHRVELMEPNLQ